MEEWLINKTKKMIDTLRRQGSNDGVRFLNENDLKQYKEWLTMEHIKEEVYPHLNEEELYYLKNKLI